MDLTILFYPERVDDPRLSRMYRILKETDIRFHSDPSQPFNLHIFWSYTPHSIKPDHITLYHPEVINRGCWDISKVKVNCIFDDLFVDPYRHKGVCVEKKDMQGKHLYHRLVKTPLKPKEGYVYQRYINQKEDGCFIRYRVYYAEGITHVVKFWQESPFLTKIVKTELIHKRELFTAEQEQDFNEKCCEFGFDLGEVDVLWDGKPMVIDVNNIVGGKFIKGYTDMPYTKEIDNIILEYLYDKARDNKLL